MIEDDKIEKQRHPAYGARKRSLVPVAVALPELSRLFSTHVCTRKINLNNVHVKGRIILFFLPPAFLLTSTSLGRR